MTVSILIIISPRITSSLLLETEAWWMETDRGHSSQVLKCANHQVPSQSSVRLTILLVARTLIFLCSFRLWCGLNSTTAWMGAMIILMMAGWLCSWRNRASKDRRYDYNESDFDGSSTNLFSGNLAWKTAARIHIILQFRSMRWSVLPFKWTMICWF